MNRLVLAGLVLLPTFGVGIVVASVFGRRPEIRWKLIVGALGQVVIAVLLLFVGPEAALWALLLIAVVVGVPQGIVNLAIQNTLYHQADPARMGATSGLLRTFMYLGAMLASAATGAFFHTTATTDGLHDLAWFMLCAAVIFLVITLVDRSLRRVDRLATGQQD
ncbi:MFS transporter [Leifsonia sp. McL0607]|uniref:MFS transporter n=1 Tax=Leifsonia sp. McL0607 TaxID=3415672 RepID=UPI003CF89B13